jgi:hypothetical protein
MHATAKENVMLRACARRGVVGGTALVVGLVGLTIGQGAARASAPLPVSQAGPVTIWGPGAGDDGPVPSPTAAQTSEAFTKVIANGETSAIGLTAAGTVELLGNNPFVALSATDAIPTGLAGKTVIDIAGDTTYGNGIAVTSDGGVYTWNIGIEGWASTLPAASTLQGSKAAAISSDATQAAVVKQDGSVLAWGSNADGDHGQNTPPAGLTGVSSVSFGGSSTDVYALKSDGTLVAWGDNTNGQTDLPAVTTDASDGVNVTQVASLGSSEVALLSDGTLAAWGGSTTADPLHGGTVNDPPAALSGKEVVALGSNSKVYFAIDSTGQVYTWGQAAGSLDPAFTELPEGLDPANVTGLSMNDYYATAIQATFGYVAKPTVSGTPKVGQTLTATPATFTATPDSTTSQWLANGAAIAGATGTTYTLTAAQVGKTITYSTTATRGTETATATSTPTAAVAAATTPGGGGGTTHPVPPPTAAQKQLAKDQAKLAKDQAGMKKAQKALKKAHGAKKSKLKKKLAKLKKQVKKDKKAVTKDQQQVKAGK